MSKPNKATKPLRMPVKMLKCFSSQEQWDEYKALAQYSAGDGFTPCTDCTPEFKTEMQYQHRCQWPRTTFSTPYGGLIGHRRK